MATRSKTRKHHMGLMQHMDAVSGQMPWYLTPWPTQGMARLAGMPYEDYVDFIARACLVDTEDYLQRWEAFNKYQEGLREFLQGAHLIHYLGDGTDLWVQILPDRTWKASDGRWKCESGVPARPVAFSNPHRSVLPLRGVVQMT